MRIRMILFTVLLCMVFALLMVGCEQPEYYHPYGEGVDPDSVTTGTFISRTTTTRTTVSTETITTTLPQPMEVIVPEGFRLCPDCQGVKIVCDECDGTGEVAGDVLDPDVYVDYTKACENCSLEDPGYYFCDTCRNELIIEE